MSNFNEPAKTHSEFSLIVNMIHRIRRILLPGFDVNTKTNNSKLVCVDHFVRYTEHGQCFDDLNSTSTMYLPRPILEQCLPDIANLYAYVRTIGRELTPNSPSAIIHIITRPDNGGASHTQFAANTSGINYHAAFARRRIATRYMSHFVKVAPSNWEARSVNRVLYPPVPLPWYTPNVPLPREVEDYLLVVANQSLSDLEYIRAHSQRCSLITLNAIKQNIFGVFNYSIRYRPKWAGCDTLINRIRQTYDPRVDSSHTPFGQAISSGSENAVANIKDILGSLYVIHVDDNLRTRLKELQDFFQPLCRENW